MVFKARGKEKIFMKISKSFPKGKWNMRYRGGYGGIMEGSEEGELR